MFQSGKCTGQWERLRRVHFTSIPWRANNLQGYAQLAAEILEESKEMQTVILEPNAWMEAFGYRSAGQQQRINEWLVAHVLDFSRNVPRGRECE